MNAEADPTALAAEAARTLLSGGPDRIHLACVLGSGWSAAADQLGETLHSVQLADLPGFSAPTVAGHGGEVRLVRTVNQKVAAVFTGRHHFYERRDVDAVVHGVRTAAAAGASQLVVTNGCGGLDSVWPPGTPVLIRDHINLTGATPLRGARFIDMSEAYSLRLRELARSVAPELPEGVYVQFSGPQYETPAEVGMARAIGGDLVGMSTTLETLAAREAGLEVLGISLVTNAAAGTASPAGEPATLDHQEVIAAGRDAGPRLSKLLTDLMAVL